MAFDNGRQFDTDKLRHYYVNHGIQTSFTAIVRPQANGQDEYSSK